MRPFGWVLMVSLIGAATRGADEDATQLRRLVGRLASSDFRERESASRELERLGPAAVAPLREAARTGDAETRRRAGTLVDQIERRQAVSRVLAPTYVSLNFDRVPLGPAVADLSQRTGMPISLHGDASSLEGRTVSLVAEKVTAWQAVQLFCNCAGLHEWDGLSSGLPGLVTAPADGPHVDGLIVLGQIQVRRGQVGAVTAPLAVSRVALIEKAEPAVPTHLAGAVRVRAAPPGAPFPIEGGKDQMLVLHISAETRLHVDGAMDVRIERAIDERGRERTGRPVWPEAPDYSDDWPRGARVPPQLTNRKHGPVGIRFVHDDDAPKRLRELAGVVTVQAFAAEPAVEVAKPARTVGQIVRGGGVALSLLSFTRHVGDEIRVTAEVQLPFGTRLDQPVAGPIGLNGRGGGFGRNLIWTTIEPEPAAVTGTDYQGLSIEDAAGRAFPAAMGATEITGLFQDHYTVHVMAIFRPPVIGAEPARVRLAVQRPTTVDVPFVLRDVPLP
jgi:hypothetical protein